jgi:hypothetical protein
MEMGISRTGDGALGLAAMMRWQPRGFSLAVLSLAAFVLTGCKLTGDLVAAGAGGASAAATANPAVGIAVGIGVHAATDATFKYLGRKRQQGEQDAIAAVVATTNPGESHPWTIRHTIPIGNEHGTVSVTRVIATPLTTCKEVVFSVIDGDRPDSPRAWYTTTACQQGARWKWAAAEPAVERWGYLQ